MAHHFPGPPTKAGVGGSAWNVEANGGDTEREAEEEVEPLRARKALDLSPETSAPPSLPQSLCVTWGRPLALFGPQLSRGSNDLTKV